MTVHTMPIIIILHNFITTKNINYKYILFGGVLIIVSGILYDLFTNSIPYQDPPPELIEKEKSNLKTKYWFYFIGLVLTTVGLARLIARKLILSRKNS